MTDTEKFDLILDKMGTIDNRLGIIESKVDGIESRLGTIESKVDGMENKLGSIENKVDGIEKRVNMMDDKLTSIEVVVENEIRTNIRRVAEGHLDLSRKLNECVWLCNDIKDRQEIYDIYINMHESKLKALG